MNITDWKKCMDIRLKNQNTYYCYIETPIGRVVIEEYEKAIISLHIKESNTNEEENSANDKESNIHDKADKEYNAAKYGQEVVHNIYCKTSFLQKDGDKRYCETPLLQKAKKQLREYFAGNRREFDLPICLHGTDFQKKVWNVLQSIPYGETLSYGEVAAKIGNPKASRAVGGANNKNPIMIIVPCHRVIGADGSLVGFGGGLPAKEYLLALEGKCKSEHRLPF